MIEADQRALVRYVIQDGYGADVVFAAGTTGEWDRVHNSVRQRVIQVCAEEVAKANAQLVGSRAERDVEMWAGITAPSPEETLANLEVAVASGSAAAVLAPLSIQGIDDPVRFVARDVADVLDAQPRRIPIYLYDNADIAVDPKVPHIRTRQVKSLSRLDFVRGIKVSAPRKVLGNYTKAAASFNERGEFGIYVGDAMLIFDLFRPRSGVLGHGGRSLESLVALGRHAVRCRCGTCERVSARMGARLAGLSIRRRRAHGRKCRRCSKPSAPERARRADAAPLRA